MRMGDRLSDWRINLGHERLRLPSLPGSEGAITDAIANELTCAGIPADAWNDAIEVASAELSASGAVKAGVRKLTRRLVSVGIAAGLGGAFTREARLLSDGYFDLMRKLCDDWDWSPAIAASLLADTGLILRLAIEWKMSSAGIAEMLGARGSGSEWPWQAIQKILAKCGCEPKLGAAEMSNEHPVASLWQSDVSGIDEMFADANLDDAMGIVASVSRDLGYREDLAALLGIFFDDSEALHIPYLQMMHYQMVIAEFFDHPLTVAYEFVPRGSVGKWVFDKYNNSSDNPFLNNLKGVGNLDREWAQQRKKAHRSMAMALARILEAASAMPYGFRRILARALRLFLLKYLDTCEEPTAISIPGAAELPEIASKALNWVAGGETHTLGIVEQRIVDWVAEVQHPAHAGWRSRGLGAAVNATNISSSRMGDCDFQHPASLAIHAFEATAGELNRNYVQLHLETLEKALQARLLELEGIADLESWTIALTFVCHSYRAKDLGKVPKEVWVEDGRAIPLQVQYSTFAELAERMSRIDEAMAEGFDRRVITTLNERRTPERVRVAFRREVFI